MVICKKKEKNKKEDDKKEDGEVWGIQTIDPETKLRIASVVGKRTKEEAKTLINQVKKRSDGKSPLFTSDGTDIYKDAILSSYNKKEVKYAQVIKKKKKKGKVIRVGTKVVLGDKKEIEEILRNSIYSTTINTSFIERDILSVRQSISKCVRKTLSFAKLKCELQAHLDLYDAYFNFVRPHISLRHRIEYKKWKNRTPAMAARITDHIFSLNELLSYKIVQGYFDTS